MKNKTIKFFTYQTSKEQSIVLTTSLVGKTLTLNKKCLVLCGSSAQVDYLDDIFWTRSLWLAHGKQGSKDDNLQPALLSEEFTLVNEPDFLFLFHKVSDFALESFERVFVIYMKEQEQELKDYVKSLVGKENIIIEHYGYINGKYEKIDII